jgi:hypothetical protein
MIPSCHVFLKDSRTRRLIPCLPSTNCADTFPCNVTTQDREFLHTKSKSNNGLFSLVIQPPSLPPLLLEPVQPILWSSLPDCNGDAKRSLTTANHQGLTHSAHRSNELVAGQEMDPVSERLNHLIVQPMMMPFALSSCNDSLLLSPLQAFLRLNIEAFTASPFDAVVRLKGRTKPVHLNQVGIRCRHCAHIPAMQRVKGAVYFPSSTLGLYQAAQNMCSSHFQCGQCPEMPQSIKTLFVQLLESKSGIAISAGGRTYWSHCAREKCLVDTEFGIFLSNM